MEKYEGATESEGGEKTASGLGRRDLLKAIGVGAGAFLLVYHPPSIRSFRVAPGAMAQDHPGKSSFGHGQQNMHMGF